MSQNKNRYSNDIRLEDNNLNSNYPSSNMNNRNLGVIKENEFSSSDAFDDDNNIGKMGYNGDNRGYQSDRNLNVRFTGNDRYGSSSNLNKPGYSPSKGNLLNVKKILIVLEEFFEFWGTVGFL